MAVTADTPAPYAPPSAIMEVVNRFRRGLPAPITAEVLGRAGISDSLIPRTLQALRTLELIGEDGSATAFLEGLRRAPEPEFPKRLSEWLNTAYADVLQFVDPATADEGAIRDAFRNYNPVGQQPRMVTLFIGLYAAAGIGPDKDASPSTPRAPRAPRAPAAARPAAARQPVKRDPTPHKLRPGWTQVAAMQSQNTPELPPALAGMMASLPLNSGWTKEKRGQFLKLFETALDWCIPVVTEEELKAAQTAEEASE